ncbi:hypoxia-inducible lipid droplet-associated protein-like [Mastomys coucha]|uniref:hypoxia-inducible lipid droplet-associated protein-like n=1 Tax=Mastomys coucha TaxID=35658 RepID=UPI001261FABA|nr:hypoxia-inducible lipid droplet-associated protein-like [Mastomys coucha]
MKFTLNLYVLRLLVTMLSIFVRLMGSLGGLLESPLPGSSWITRGHLADTQPPKGLPDDPSRRVQ